mgnify:CR=1 FL=1
MKGREARAPLDATRILPGAPSKVKAGAPLVLADPDFDLGSVATGGGAGKEGAARSLPPAALRLGRDAG